MDEPVLDVRTWSALLDLNAPLSTLTGAHLTVCGSRLCAGPGCTEPGTPMDLSTPLTRELSVCACARSDDLVLTVHRWEPLAEAHHHLERAERVLARRGRMPERHQLASRDLLEVTVVLAAFRADANDPWATATLSDLHRRAAKARAALRRGWRGQSELTGSDRWVLICELEALARMSVPSVGMNVRRAATAWPLLHASPARTHLVVQAPERHQPWHRVAADVDWWADLDPLEGDMPTGGWDLFDALLAHRVRPQMALDVVATAAGTLPACAQRTFVRLVGTGVPPADAVTAALGIVA